MFSMPNRMPHSAAPSTGAALQRYTHRLNLYPVIREQANDDEGDTRNGSWSSRRADKRACPAWTRRIPQRREVTDIGLSSFGHQVMFPALRYSEIACTPDPRQRQGIDAQFSRNERPFDDIRFRPQGNKGTNRLLERRESRHSWKADHTKCEELLKRIGYSGADFAKNWSKTTTLYHPTKYAAQNQVACTTLWASVPPRHEDFYTAMEPEVADYLTAIATLIVIATIDLPRFIPLDCDLNRMPNIDTFRENVHTVVVPILNKNRAVQLPPESYRS